MPAGAALPGDGVSFTDPQQRTVLDSLVRLSMSLSDNWCTSLVNLLGLGSQVKAPERLSGNSPSS